MLPASAPDRAGRPRHAGNCGPGAARRAHRPFAGRGVALSSGLILPMQPPRLWLDGELVHIEDLVLHDAHMDQRAPTHELTRAHEVLRLRRQVLANKPDWALGRDGLCGTLRARRRCRGTRCHSWNAHASGTRRRAVPRADERSRRHDGDSLEPTMALRALALWSLGAELAALDAALSRANVVLDSSARCQRSIESLAGEVGRNDRSARQATGQQKVLSRAKSAWLYDSDWDEPARLGASGRRCFTKTLHCRH
jgi:hypothetical protein